MSAGRVLRGRLRFLGAAIALAAGRGGMAVTGCTHSPLRPRAGGEPFQVVSGDFTRREEVEGWGRFEAVIHAASSRRGGRRNTGAFMSRDSAACSRLRAAAGDFRKQHVRLCANWRRVVTEESPASRARDRAHLACSRRDRARARRCPPRGLAGSTGRAVRCCYSGSFRASAGGRRRRAAGSIKSTATMPPLRWPRSCEPAPRALERGG